MQYDLRDRTLELVCNRPRSQTLEQIAQATEINHSWLKAFIAGRMNDPSANKVWTLYCFLSGKHHDL